MTRTDKLIARFKKAKNDFTWNELISMLEILGYRQQQGAGSRVRFENGNPEQKINLHKPHPGNEVKVYVIRELRKKLKEWRMI